MKIRDYLSQYQDEQKNIKNIEYEIQQLKHSLTDTSFKCTFNTKVKKSPTYDRMGTVYSMVDDKKRELEHAKQKALKIRFNLITDIFKLHNIKYQKILCMRYIDGMELNRIAIKLNYTHGYIRELMSKAVRELDKILKEEKNTHGTEDKRNGSIKEN